MGQYIWLQNFEGSGRPAKVSLEALRKTPNRTVVGRIRKKIPKPIRRNNANGKVVGEMEAQSQS